MRLPVCLALLFATWPAFAAPVDYATQIQPIFEAKCVGCHGEKRQLGDLALHTGALAEVLENGMIVAEDAESSEVYNRLILEEGDKQLMPKGKKKLPTEEIELIRNWINEGASFVAAEGGPMPAEDKSEEPAESKLPNPAPVAAEVVQRLADAGANVVPLYAGSPLLSIGFPSDPEKVTDETIDLVTAAGPNVVWLDLGGAKVTDAGVAKLAACESLLRLHLEMTGVTDAAADTLAGLKRLEYLNLYGTQITDATLAKVAALPRLSRFYVWQTGVSYEAAKKMMAERQGLEINLGSDHPGVVRDRLTKELERTVASKQEAAKTAKQAEATLEESKKQIEAAASREAELKQELEALDEPADKKPEEKAEEKKE
jgi:mono/diheme cytochrome c family protein